MKQKQHDFGNFVTTGRFGVSAGRRVGRRLLAAALCAVCLVSGGVAMAATNPAGNGNGVAIGSTDTKKPTAPTEKDVAIGEGATITNGYNGQSGNIAIGNNARVVYWPGGNLSEETNFGATGNYNDLTIAGGIAIGDNTVARSGGIMLGGHTYKGRIGDSTVDPEKTADTGYRLYSTTVGTNSYNNGLFSSVTGAFSALTSSYDRDSSHFLSYLTAQQNFGAVITGSFNTIEYDKERTDNAFNNLDFRSNQLPGEFFSGIANSIVGVANQTKNSNGSLVFGTGNKITNSLKAIDFGTEDDSEAKDVTRMDAKDWQDTLRMAAQAAEGGGGVLAIGGGNTADWAVGAQLIGVNNTLTGTEETPSTFVKLDGYKNTGTNLDDVVVVGQKNQVSNVQSALIIGNNRSITGTMSQATEDKVAAPEFKGSIIIGSSDEQTKTDAKGVTVLGYNANATVEDGVALGSKSIASTEKNTEGGYNAATGIVGYKAGTDPAWNSSAGAVSVGDVNLTRQITNVAAGKTDTDAVNVAQLKTAVTEVQAGDNITVTKSNDATDGHAIYTISGTPGITYEAGKNVTIEDGKISAIDTRNTVADGENTTVTDTKNADGTSTFKVNVKAGDVKNGETGFVTGGTVYNETRVKQDGNYIRQSNTAGENLTALDKQVKTNADSITNLDNRVNVMSGDVNRLRNRINRVGAGAAALAALHPQDFDPDNKWDFAAGYGNYRDANAVSVGAFYRPNETLLFSVGGSFGGGENMMNAGISVKLGQGSDMPSSRAAMAAEIRDLRRDNQAMRQEIEALKQLVEEKLGAEK